MNKKKTLHFIQDVPTPHNNALLKALHKEGSVDLRIWYAQPENPQYGFGPDLANKVITPLFYGSKVLSIKLLWSVLSDWRERVFIVGWTNPTTRALIVLFWLLRRNYGMWFDLPQERHASFLRNLVRNFYYFMLRTSRSKVFCVGKQSMEFFCKKGFIKSRLVCMPILTDINRHLVMSSMKRHEIRQKYGLGQKDLFIVTGSRLIYQKGFDLLINAVAMLDHHVRDHVKVLIIGRGNEKQSLLELASTKGIQRQIYIEEWMCEDDFVQHIASGDLAVHPARFDAYGGITLCAMAAGVPVIGSTMSGSAMDRIVHGINGWLFESEDSVALSKIIRTLYMDRDAISRAGKEARLTAEKWDPENIAKVFLKELA